MKRGATGKESEERTRRRLNDAENSSLTRDVSPLFFMASSSSESTSETLFSSLIDKIDPDHLLSTLMWPANMLESLAFFRVALHQGDLLKGVLLEGNRAILQVHEKYTEESNYSFHPFLLELYRFSGFLRKKFELPTIENDSTVLTRKPNQNVNINNLNTILLILTDAVSVKHFNLVEAILESDLDQFKTLLLEKKADIDTVIKGNTLFQIASIAGELQIAEYLLNKGAKVNAQNPETKGGDTPIHLLLKNEEIFKSKPKEALALLKKMLHCLSPSDWGLKNSAGITVEQAVATHPQAIGVLEQIRAERTHLVRLAGLLSQMQEPMLARELTERVIYYALPEDVIPRIATASAKYLNNRGWWGEKQEVPSSPLGENASGLSESAAESLSKLTLRKN